MFPLLRKDFKFIIDLKYFVPFPISRLVQRLIPINHMIRINSSLGLATLTLFAVAASSQAAVLLSESFDYAAGSSFGLNGGTGFGGAYTGSGSITTPGQTFTDITSAGNKFTTVGNNSGAFRVLSAPIGTDAGVIFVRFLTSSATTTIPGYAGLSFFSSATDPVTISEELFMGNTGSSDNYGFEVTDVGAVATSIPVSNSTTLLVYRLSFGTASDTIDLYVNPGSTLPGAPDATFTTPNNTAFPATFDRIRLQSGGGLDLFNFDEIQIATTAAEVLPIPEPGSIGLMVGSIALLSFQRRRKEKRA